MTIRFFLEESEQIELLKAIENSNNIVYVHGLRRKNGTSDIEVYRSIEQIKDSLTPPYGVHGYEAWIITVLNRKMRSNCEYISSEQLKEDERELYLNGISYDPGGVFDNSNLIHGQFYTIDNNNAEQIELLKQIRKQLNKISEKRINGWYIGKKAYLNRGKYRFITIGVESPILYDLAVE